MLPGLRALTAARRHGEAGGGAMRYLEAALASTQSGGKPSGIFVVIKYDECRYYYDTLLQPIDALVEGADHL